MRSHRLRVEGLFQIAPLDRHRAFSVVLLEEAIAIPSGFAGIVPSGESPSYTRVLSHVAFATTGAYVECAKRASTFAITLLYYWAQELVAARHSPLEDLVDIQGLLPKRFRHGLQQVPWRKPDKSEICLFVCMLRACVCLLMLMLRSLYRDIVGIVVVRSLSLSPTHYLCFR